MTDRSLRPPPWRWHLVWLLALVSVSPAAAQQFEISGSIGSTPYVDRQSIAYRLAGPQRTPLLSFDTSDPIDVTADGGLVLGVGVGWYLHPKIAIEGRLDSIALDAENTSLVFRTRLDLPGSTLGTTQDVTVGPARLSYHHPLIGSMGLRIRQPAGRVGLAVAGGVSVLPAATLTAVTPVSVGSLAFNGLSLLLPFDLSVAQVEVRGRAPARVGAHLAGGVDIALSNRVQFRPELRYIALQTMQVEWTDVTTRTPLGPLGATVGEPVTGLTSLELRSNFWILQTAVVVRF